MAGGGEKLALGLWANSPSHGNTRRAGCEAAQITEDESHCGQRAKEEAEMKELGWLTRELKMRTKLNVYSQ